MPSKGGLIIENTGKLPFTPNEVYGRDYLIYSPKARLETAEKT